MKNAIISVATCLGITALAVASAFLEPDIRVACKEKFAKTGGTGDKEARIAEAKSSAVKAYLDYCKETDEPISSYEITKILENI